MRNNSPAFEAFEEEIQRRSAPDHRRNLQVFTALYREAVALGVLPPDDSLDGIEADLQRTRALHVRSAPGEARAQP